MLANKTLVDSSFLIALYDEDAEDHDSVREVARFYKGSFLVPQVVLTEVLYMLRREIGIRGVLNFLDEFSASQPYLQEITVPDLSRVSEIMQQYLSANLDFVDCCMMALSERLQIAQICTLDRRDFVIFRPRHVSYLVLLP